MFVDRYKRQVTLNIEDEIYEHVNGKSRELLSRYFQDEDLEFKKYHLNANVTWITKAYGITNNVDFSTNLHEISIYAADDNTLPISGTFLKRTCKDFWQVIETLIDEKSWDLYQEEHLEYNAPYFN